MDKMQEMFKAEAQELIGQLELALLQFERNLGNNESVQIIFRVMHTLKGSAGMFGFDALSNLTHDLETIYDDIRCGNAVASPAVLDVTLRCVDHFKNILTDRSMIIPSNAENQVALLQQINNLSITLPQANSEAVFDKENHTDRAALHYISFVPPLDTLKNGTNPIYLMDDLASLGDAFIIPHLHRLPDFDELIPDECYVTFEVILETKHSLTDIQDVFLFVQDTSIIDIKSISKSGMPLMEIRKLLTSTAQAGPYGFEIVEAMVAPKLESKIKASAILQTAKEEASTIRVSSDKLDDLMNLISELVTSQARLNLLVDQYDIPVLKNAAEQMDKVSRNLRENAFNICLVPVETLVVRFQRLVRDLAKEIGKEIEFTTEGTETELDRSIIEKITDPILHALRNCIDHGIEFPEERLKEGKRPVGRITVKAYYSGTNVYIKIIDDGRGMDPDKIRKKAVEKGLIADGSNLTEQAILNLVFMPGFSTAATVTDISGRGVGMDVVKRNIEGIRGEVSLSSTVGQGTTLTLKLPLTLSILDGMLVQIGSFKYIVPLTVVDKCYELKSTQLTNDITQKHVLDGSLIPVVNLHRVFNEVNPAADATQLIKVNSSDFPVAITVDAIIGEYQAVMKPLGECYAGRNEFSGATILGDGSVALVLDTASLLKQIFSNSTMN